ncbi:PREDICTED: piggyBac transposable element-derived protein 4-like, partial [Diuraphis noxia]|uniref:piggyBac transposable element-derived protein 4-like n=1 Tax=Diuraphis noxia TaxID=143948 RepID=UPI000763A92F
RFKFTQPFGPKVPVDINSPIDIFKLFFDDDILHTFKTQSELYAAQCNQKFFTSVEELQAFFGCLIIMGFHKLPTIRCYWSTDANFQVPRISSIMSLKRFLSILRFLHLNDNLSMPKRGHVNYDKLYKVRPLINKLNEKFFSNFNPSRNIAIDESMVAFKGRTTIKQYMPLKPIKRGIKVWAAACSKTGYLLQFEVYQGKQGDPEIGLGEKVVTHLANLYDNKGYCFYFDGFFSNIPMVKSMVEKNNFACGTIKSNKKYFPSGVLKDDKELKQGQFDVVTSNEITISKWKDRGKKCVNVISNMHGGSCIGSVYRRDNLGVKQVVKAPAAIVDYNKYMGGVDHFDQFHSYYNVAWKSRRWWLKIFYYLLDACIVN